MIIKILNIADKEYDVYAPEGKSYKMYQKWCIVDVDGVEKKLMVKTFSQQKDKQGNDITESSIKVFEGAEFDSNVNEMKIEKTRKQDSDYDELTIKAEKKDGGYSGKSGFSGGQKFVKISMAQLLYAVGESENIAKGLSDVDELKQRYFASILDVMVRMTEIPTEEKKDVAKEVEKAFDGKEVFTDEDIPF